MNNEDIKVLEDYFNRICFDETNKITADLCTIGINEIRAIENLINRNRILEKEIKLMKSVNLEDNYIPKSKVRVLIEKYRAFGWHNKDDEYWANRILDGFEELLQEGDK